MYKNAYSFTLLLLISFSFTFAQNYRHFPPTGGRWKIEVLHANATPPVCSMIEAYYHYTNGDTMIAGYPVTVIRNTNGVMCAGQNWCWGTTGARDTYLHQDSAGRVSIVDPNGGSLHAVFDYSLQPGDSLYDVQTYRGDMEYRVDSVDTVTFIDNIARKRLFLSYGSYLTGNQNQAIWVEGIGDLLHGPLPEWEFEQGFNNHCYTEDGLTLSTNTNFSSWCSSNCDLLIGTTPSTMTDWSVAPNPSGGAWHITSGTPITEGVTAKVWNLAGQEVWSGRFDAGNEIIIDLGPTIPKGLYLLNLSTDNGSTSSIKLMRE